MADEPRPPSRPQDRKTPAMGGNVVWYLLALGVGTILLVNFMGEPTQVEIEYGDLVTLIEKGCAAKNPKAAIDVTEGTPEKKQVVRYSNLDNLKIGPSEIAGTVTRQVLEPEADRTKPKTDVAFETPRRGLVKAIIRKADHGRHHDC